MSGPSRAGESRSGARMMDDEGASQELPRLVYSQLSRVCCSDRDRTLAVPPNVWLRLCMELRLSAGASQLRELLGGRYVIKAQLLKAQPVEREMRAFDVVVSQSMGKLSESSFEFLYSIREADNRAADHAGRLLATALAVCVPVRKPGERMPLSEGFKELVAQSRAAERRRDSETDMAGEAYVPDEQYPVGNGDSDDTRVNVQGADRLALQQMLTMQLSSFHSPEIANNSALEVHGHIMSMPVLLRPSDEDWNCHVNNTSFIRFFDDALCIMRETMPAVRALASVAPSKAAFDYLRECSLACTGCHVLCKFYDGSEAEGVDDGMHAWNPDGLASLAMLFRGFDASGKDQIFARARYAFPKV